METEKEKTSEHLGERERIKEELRLKKEKARNDEAEISRCSECGSNLLVQDRVKGELVCGQCGLVLDEKLIDHGPEWRNFDNGQKNERIRTGPASTLTVHDKGLSTCIDYTNKDASGAALPSRTRAQVRRMIRWQRRIRISNARERSLAFALSEMNRMVSAGGLSNNVFEMAAKIYREAASANIIRGRSIEGMTSAALYAACRLQKVPRTLDEIGAISRVSRLEIGRCYRMLSAELHLGILPPSPAEFLSRFCSPLSLSDFSVQARAAEILRQVEEKCLTNGKSPEGLAAAAIYCAARESHTSVSVTQKKLAKIAGVTEVTIRNINKELVKKLNLNLS